MLGVCSLSPKHYKQEYTRRLREEQDAEFQRSLEADRQRESERAAAEEAASAAKSAAAKAAAAVQCVVLLVKISNTVLLWLMCTSCQSMLLL